VLSRWGAIVVLVAAACGGMPAAAPAGAAGSDPCASAGTRLVECGFENDPAWLDSCRQSPRYVECLQAQGTSCNGLASCGFAEVNHTACGGNPAAAKGTAGCEATLGCLGACKGDVGCLCRCNAEMTVDVAAAVGVMNQCYLRHCQGCGASGSGECNACFAKNCSPKYDSMCRAH